MEQEREEEEEQEEEIKVREVIDLKDKEGKAWWWYFARLLW